MILNVDKFPRLRVFEQVEPALAPLSRDVVLGAQTACFTGQRLCGRIIYNMEPLYPGCRPFECGYLDILANNVVLDYSAQNVEFLRQLGVDAFHLPYGVHPALVNIPHQSKSIDVLFVGSAGSRRSTIVQGLQRRYNVVWAQDIFGQQLLNLLAMARVHLNIHWMEGTQLEVVRLNHLLANGLTVVTEPGCEPDVNAQYWEHCVMTEDIEAGVGYALENPQPVDVAGLPKMDCTAADEWLRAKGY